MWWRVVFVIGAFGAAIFGCNRRNEEEAVSPHREVPNSAVLPSSANPFVPRPPSQYSPPSSFPLIPTVAPTLDCSRFSPLPNRDRYSFSVTNLSRELSILNQQVIPRINRQHGDEIRAGNFTELGRDLELSGMLSSLTGASMYLKEGNETALDTESDWMNLLIVRDFLFYLENTPTNADRQSVTYRIRRDWQNGIITADLKGYYFRDDRVPHRQNYRPGPAEASIPRFRIVTQQNAEQYPDIQDCGVQRDNSTVISSYGLLP